MAVTKRTRFEVLRRDNHNLVTACKDCNAGKTSTNPTGSIVSDVTSDAIRWAQARKLAAEKLLVQRDDDRELVKPFLKNWTDWDAHCHFLPNDWEVSVHSWLKHGMPMEILTDATDSAFSRPTVESRYVFRYMAGIIRNKMADLDAATAAELGVSDGA